MNDAMNGGALNPQVTAGRIWLDRLVASIATADRALESGRSLLGRVEQLEMEPGLIRARVDGSRSGDGSTVHVAQIGVRTFDDGRWEELTRAIERSGPGSAAVLAGVMTEELRAALVPSTGEVSCHCTCSDGRDLCRHGAAVALASVEVFDRDPFALALIRGRGRDELRRKIRDRRAERLGLATDDQDHARGRDPGTSAAAAYRRKPVPFTRSITAPAQAGRLVPLAVAPPIEAAVDSAELAELVADAAERARSMLAGDGESDLDLTVGADVARRAVNGDRGRIAAATGLPLDELSAAALAFEQGGAAGLAVSRRRWEPETGLLQPGVAALGPGARVRGNAVSSAGVQLRLDPDGRWWRFEPDDALGWVLVAPSAADPADLVEPPDLDGG